jgi:hypothetical protein
VHYQIRKPFRAPVSHSELAFLDESRASECAPFRLGQSRMSRQRGMRASLWLRRLLGKRRTFRSESPANAAMRAADECHPLPDQLHPCSPFFRFSSQPVLRQFKEPKRSMRFHDAFDRFRGRSCFCARELFVPVAWCLFASLVSSRSSSAGSTSSRGCRVMKRATKIGLFELP